MRTSGSSYKTGSTSIGISAEINRLHAQSMLTWDKEFRNLQWFGLRNGMDIPEAGCGPGYVAQQLAEQFPDSSVTALDIDGKLLAHARRLFEQHGLTNIKLVQSSVYETGLPDESFDFVIVRMLFLHLHEPGKAIIELKRILKSGGKLVVTDIDDGVFGIIEPEIEDFHRILKKLTAVQQRGGGNRLIDRRLPRLLESEGFSGIELETIAAHSDVHGREGLAETLNPERLCGLADSGVLTDDEFGQLHAAINRLKTDPDAYVMMLFLMVCGIKKAEGTQKEITVLHEKNRS